MGFELLAQAPAVAAPYVTLPLAILGILCANVVISEWLCRKTFLRHFGTALIVILITAVVANLGVLPKTGDNAVYGVLLGDVVNLAVFWMLLRVNLRELLKAGLPMILMFVVGAIGAAVGAVLGMLLINGSHWFPDQHQGLAAMFTGTYVGGSINFVAMAEAYKVDASGTLYAGAMVVDNIVTTFWMVMTIAIPRGLAWWANSRGKAKSPSPTAPLVRKVDKTASVAEKAAAETSDDVVLDPEADDTETVRPFDLALTGAIGMAAVVAAGLLADWIKRIAGLNLPSVLYLTVFALIIAQTPLAARLRGARALGLFAVYLFLAVIGALCDLERLAEFQQGVRLLLFAATLVGVHGLIIFGVGALFRVDRDIIAVASQANVGGGTSALANARSLGRNDLALAAILIGSLGTALGNFLGLAAGWLLGLF